MCEHGTTRTAQIRGESVGVDSCIYETVLALNRGGVETVASCCGHGNRPGNIALKDGRELLILPDYETARSLDKLWPDIHGEPLGAPRSALEILGDALASEDSKSWVSREAVENALEALRASDG